VDLALPIRSGPFGTGSMAGHASCLIGLRCLNRPDRFSFSILFKSATRGIRALHVFEQVGTAEAVIYTSYRLDRFTSCFFARSLVLPFAMVVICNTSVYVPFLKGFIPASSGPTSTAAQIASDTSFLSACANDYTSSSNFRYYLG
jgi:hypothetical protein